MRSGRNGNEKFHLVWEWIVYDFDCIIKLIMHNRNFPDAIHSQALERFLRRWIREGGVVWCKEWPRSMVRNNFVMLFSGFKWAADMNYASSVQLKLNALQKCDESACERECYVSDLWTYKMILISIVFDVTIELLYGNLKAWNLLAFVHILYNQSTRFSNHHTWNSC